MMEVVRCKDKEGARIKAGKKLNQLFLSHQHVPVLFLSSGGSALELLHEIELSCLPRDLKIGVLDERKDVESEQSNEARLKATIFFTALQERNASFLDISKEDCENRKVLITQGVGADGHTAGIFPFPEDPKKFHELFENDRALTVEYGVGEKSEYPERMTVTVPFLRKVDHSVVFMLGEEKRGALERVLAEEGTLYETPARIVREMKDVTIFTDIV